MQPVRWIILMVLAALVLLLMQWGKKKGKETRATRLMKQYKVLDAETLSAIPDGELVEAVVAHILAQADDSRRPDPVRVLAGMEHGPTVVYSVWAVCKEMVGGDFAALMNSATRELVELAEDGLNRLGAFRCEQSLKALRQAYEAKEDLTSLQEAFQTAVSEEQPLGLCEEYIRNNQNEFVDVDESDDEE